MMDKKTIISAFRVAVAAACAISALSYGDEDPASIQHRYMTPSMRVSTNAWLSVSGNVERIVSAATNGLATAEDVNLKADKSALDNHEENTNNPHKVTAAQVGAVPLNAHSTVGPLFSLQYTDTTGSGDVLSFGVGAGPGGGTFVCSKLYCPGYNMFFANGVMIVNEESVAGASILARIKEYGGDFKTARAEVDNLIAASAATKADKATTLAGYGITNAATEAYVDDKVRKAVLPTDPTFSNAVLAVGLNIDTDSVAVLNEIASTFGGFPIEGTATTVGGLLAALAAAVAWLKKNKADKATTLAGYGITDAATMASIAPEYSPSSSYSVGAFVFHDGNIYQCTTAITDGGEAWNAAHWEMRKLDDFFTNSNSLLNGRLAYSRNATGLKDRAFNTLSFDGTEFNLSTALEAVTPTASGQPRDLLIVATATAATTIGYTAGTIKGDKPTIDGSGTWLITLTEYASGVWYCRQIKMEDAA